MTYTCEVGVVPISSSFCSCPRGINRRGDILEYVKYIERYSV